MNVQRVSDNIIEKLFLGFIPNWLTPNHFSYIRIALVPVIFYLLNTNNLIWATIVFVIAAITDFIDGTLARKRNQTTDLGKVLDPIADKMLIATVLVYIGFEYLIIKIFIVVIAFEIVANFASSLLATYLGRPLGANLFGKIKMVFQSFAAVLFLLGLIIDNSKLILISEYLLFIALFFAILAGIENLRRRFWFKYKKRVKVKN